MVVYHVQKVSGKLGWKENGTQLFWVVPVENFLSKRTPEKLVLFFQMEYSKQKFVFHFFKAIFDTSFRPLRPFCGFRVSFVETCGLTGLPV